MAGVASELRRRGAIVTGSDCDVFPPMDSWLADRGIAFERRYAARNVTDATRLVIVGSLVTRENPEWRAARRRSIPVTSLAEFLGNTLLRGGTNLVVVGTNGKTTSTAMLAWILDRQANSVDYLIGGTTRQWEDTVRLRGSKRRVLEGDEYPVGQNDLTPKFLHYRPMIGVVTNVAHDHCEVFPSRSDYETLFDRFASTIPPRGTLVLTADDPMTPRLASACRGQVVTVGVGSRADRRVRGLRERRHDVRFEMDGVEFRIPVIGGFNAQNAALAATAAESVGISLADSARALADFRGVRYRQEIHRDTRELTIIEDEGAHPSAVETFLGLLRRRYAGRRILFAFQPRMTGGRDDCFQQDLPGALSVADVLFALPVSGWKLADRRPFSDRLLADQTRRLGVRFHRTATEESLWRTVHRELKPGDVLAFSLGFRREALRDRLAALKEP